MAAGRRTTERLSKKFPKCIISTAIIGDSQTKYIYQHFNPHSSNAPGFITYNGCVFSDVLGLLEHVPGTVRTIMLHVGTNDVAKDGAFASLERLRKLLGDIQSKRPEIGHIYISLVLPRTVNRRLRHSNYRFIKWFNNQVTNFNVGVKKLCRTSPRASYIHHAFSEMPARRVLAADGLHPSFEGVALLALHYQIATMKNGNRQPAGWSATVPSTGPSDEAGSDNATSPNETRTDEQSTDVGFQQPRSPLASSHRRSTSLTDTRSPYFLRGTYAEATRTHLTQQK